MPGKATSFGLNFSNLWLLKPFYADIIAQNAERNNLRQGNPPEKRRGAAQASGGVFVHLAQKGKADFFAFAHGAIAKKQGAGKVLSKTTEFLFFLEMRRLL